MTVTMTQSTPMLFGQGAAKEIGARVKEAGGTKTLLVYGQQVKATGIPARLKGYLEAEGISVVEFDKIEHDPTDVFIDKYTEEIRALDFDNCVAVGGGSCMDAAKCFAGLYTNPGTIRNYFYHIEGNDSMMKNRMPFFAIPTTAGTGSEVSEYALIIDTKDQFKSSIMYPPTLALIDPECMVDLPPELTATTALDAFAHCAESTTSPSSTPRGDALSAFAFSAIVKWLPVAMKDGHNIEARSNLAIASSFGALGFNDANLNIGHGIAHTLGVFFGVPHGHACALTLPTIEAWCAKGAPDKVRLIGESMGLTIPADASCDEIGTIVADALRKLLRDCGIKSLREIGIKRDELLALAERISIMEHISGFIETTPGEELTKEGIEALLIDMYDNYQ